MIQPNTSGQKKFHNSSISNKIQKIFDKRKPILWRSAIIVTRRPIPKDLANQTDKQKEQHTFDSLKSIPSILHNYLPNKTYTLEITSDNGIKIKICISETKKENAEIGAQVILHILRSKFHNMDGIVEVKPIYDDSDIFWNDQFCELELPPLPYRKSAPILENINTISKGIKSPIKFFILFKPVHHDFSDGIFHEISRLKKNGILNEIVADKLMYKWRSYTQYKIRVFFQCKDKVYRRSNQDSNRDQNQDPKQNSNQKSIQSPNKPPKSYRKSWTNTKETQIIHNLISNGIVNFRGYKAVISLRASQVRNMLLSSILTGGTVVIPSSIDLHLYHPFPIQNAIREPLDNFISPIMKDPTEQSISIGKYMSKGSMTEIDAELYIDSLRQSMTAFGLSRSGKTAFVSNILIKTHQKCPYISQLIICMKDELEIEKYEYDQITGYDDPQFKLPWLFASTKRGFDIEAIAQYLTSAIGLLDNGKRFLVDYLKEFNNIHGKFPRRFEDFLRGFLDFLNRDENQYGPSHMDIFQSNKNRIKAFIDCDRFNQVVEGSSKTPQWFIDWINPEMAFGKRIIIDLQKFSDPEKKFIVMAILHMIKTYAQPHEDGKLRRLLVCDEAHIMFYKPKTNDHYDADNIGQYKLDEQMDIIINQMANTGTGAIFADQNPFKVLDSIRSQIGTSVCFRISREGAELFSRDTKLQKFLHTMPPYMCWIESGPASSQFFMKSDPPIKEIEDKDAKKIIPSKRENKYVTAYNILQNSFRIRLIKLLENINPEIKYSNLNVFDIIKEMQNSLTTKGLDYGKKTNKSIKNLKNFDSIVQNSKPFSKDMFDKVLKLFGPILNELKWITEEYTLGGNEDNRVKDGGA